VGLALLGTLLTAVVGELCPGVGVVTTAFVPPSLAVVCESLFWTTVDETGASFPQQGQNDDRRHQF
jgi:uncharacterized membrane protein